MNFACRILSVTERMPAPGKKTSGVLAERVLPLKAIAGRSGQNPAAGELSPGFSDSFGGTCMRGYRKITDGSLYFEAFWAGKKEQTGQEEDYKPLTGKIQSPS